MTDLGTSPNPSPPEPTAPAPGPNQVAPTDEGRRRGMAGWIALFAVLALLIGGALGYAAAMPSKNDVAKQRDDAKAQVDQLQAEVNSAQAATTAAAAARDKCSKAAVDAKDLIDQDTNLWNDFGTLMSMTPGSPEEVALEQHINTQADTMDAQHDVVVDELAACKAAVNG